MSYGIISFLRALSPGRGAVPVADDNPLPVFLSISPATGSPGQLSLRVQSLASTNSTLVKNAPGVVYSITLTNSGAVAFLKLYNKATAPTVGTDVPVVTYAIPAGGSLTVSYGNVAKFFSLGIGYGITGLVGDADTTAVAANQITGSIEYA